MRSKLLRLVVTGGLVGGVSMLGYGLYERRRTVPSSSTSFEKGHKRWNSNWDRRDPVHLLRSRQESRDCIVEESAEELNKLTPKAARHIILIRHGQYHEMGEDDSICGLTDLGREQAVLTGQRLKALDLPYCGILSSTKSRAMETADIVHRHLPGLQLVHTDLLCEGRPIPSEPPTGKWRPIWRFAIDGTRIEAAFRNIFHRADPQQERDSYEIVVCHANVIRYFICRALQFPPEAWQRLRLHHCSITWIGIQPSGEVHLYYLGNIGHLPRNMITSNNTGIHSQQDPLS